MDITVNTFIVDVNHINIERLPITLSTVGEQQIDCSNSVSSQKSAPAVDASICLDASSDLPFKSGYSGYSRVPGNFFDLPGNFRKILLFQKILVVNPKSQRHELVEVKSVSFPSKW